MSLLFVYGDIALDSSEAFKIEEQQDPLTEPLAELMAPSRNLVLGGVNLMGAVIA